MPLKGVQNGFSLPEFSLAELSWAFSWLALDDSLLGQYYLASQICRQVTILPIRRHGRLETSGTDSCVA